MKKEARSLVFGFGKGVSHSPSQTPISSQQEEARDPETFQVSQVVPYPPAQTGWMMFQKFESHALIERAYCPAVEKKLS